MPKASSRLEAARKAYREALEAARERPTPEAWARLLAAGKELSSAEESRPRSRRGRRAPPARVEPVEQPANEVELEPIPSDEPAATEVDGAEPA